MRTHASVIIGLVWTIAAASAQEPATSSAGPATVAAAGGLTAGMHGTGPMLGGSIAYELNEWFAVEGSGVYFNRGSGANAISANTSLLVSVVPSSRRTVPYFAIGGGVYRASFDLGNTRFFGSMGQQFAPGTQMVPFGSVNGFGMMTGAYDGPAVWDGPWNGATFTPAHMPVFYANRMGILTVPADGRWGTRSFTDPALVIGGGVRLGLTPHLSVRPDVRAISMFGGGHMNTLGAFSLNLGYRF